MALLKLCTTVEVQWGVELSAVELFPPKMYLLTQPGRGGTALVLWSCSGPLPVAVSEGTSSAAQVLFAANTTGVCIYSVPRGRCAT